MAKEARRLMRLAEINRSSDEGGSIQVYDMRVSSLILEEAAKGSVEHLRALSEALTPENYNLAALDAPLDLLSRSALPGPDTDSTTALSRITTRLAALECFCAALCACERCPNAQIKRRTVKKVLDQMDGIIEWIHLCTISASRVCHGEALSRYFFSIITLVGCCKSLDAQLSKLSLSSPVMANTILAIWSCPRTDDPRQLYHNWGMGRGCGCIIVNVMGMFLTHPDGFRSICDILHDSISQLETFCSATCTRISYISEAAERRDVTIQDVQLGFTTLWENTKALTNDPKIHHALRRAGYLQSFTRCVKGLSVRIMKDDTLTLISIFFNVPSPKRKPPPGCLRSRRRGFDPSAGRHSPGVHLDWIRDRSLPINYSYFRDLQLSPTTASRILDRPGGYAWSQLAGVERRVAVSPTWNGFANGLEKMCQELDEQKQDGHLTFCDNNKELLTQHTGIWWRAKACSRCHLVMYCSPACQKDDWGKRHRGECLPMRGIYLGRRAAELRYSHATRGLHLQICQNAVAANSLVLDEQRRRIHGGRSPEGFVIVLDIRTATHAQIYLKNRKVGDCPEIEARAQEMVTKYMTRRDPRERLVEMQIAWNSERGIALLIEMRKDGAEWELGRSLVRIE
ncbi:hypothetical protein BKA70DRAFT_1236325 [Coprinopsis sp. MPI-PUGE-AT-0042]|nr:hypothetical protein BKA70DRAFT_1236325 [Coprinopsis sp. MPI-PUGE-AT-0042]